MVLRRHEQSLSHLQALEMIITLPSSTINVVELLSREYAKEKECNRRMLIKVMSSIRFLARQGLALRGEGNEELDGNFYQMLKLKLKKIPEYMIGLRRKPINIHPMTFKMRS